MKLITEVNEELEVVEIEEGTDGKKGLYLEGVFLNPKQSIEIKGLIQDQSWRGK